MLGVADVWQRAGSAACVRPLPLLAVRLPEFERIAWRSGRRVALALERQTSAAFEEAVDASLRAGDLIAHDPGSDAYAIVMAAPSREARAHSPVDCRAVLERIAARISQATNLRVETGWTILQACDGAAALRDGVRLALERGARERERYEFFAAIGHELRTPLSSIRGYLETLLDGGLEPRTSRRFLQTSLKEAQRMERMLEGMFEFSLLDLSAQTMVASRSDLRERVCAAFDAIRPAARERGIALLESVVAPAHVALDDDACMHVLLNLLDNAVKYGREGGTVCVSAAADARYVTLAVDDDGPGIAAHERESIFGLRVRGAGAAQRPGTGIGLAIVKLIAERAGGEVRVKDAPLGGARFEVALPRRAESEAVPA